MIKEIKVYSRMNMEAFIRKEGEPFPYKYWYLISIHSGDDFVTPFVRKILKEIGCQGLISMEFWDMTPTDRHVVLREHSDAIMFDENHAKKIVRFLDKIQKDRNDSVLVAHCHAGISRSGAVGVFASDYYGLDYNTLIQNNSYIQPNSHVLKTLRDITGMIPSFGGKVTKK